MASEDIPAGRLRGHMAALDETDRLIVEALRADGRMSGPRSTEHLPR